MVCRECVCKKTQQKNSVCVSVCVCFIRAIHTHTYTPRAIVSGCKRDRKKSRKKNPHYTATRVTFTIFVYMYGVDIRFPFQDVFFFFFLVDPDARFVLSNLTLATATKKPYNIFASALRSVFAGISSYLLDRARARALYYLLFSV